MSALFTRARFRGDELDAERQPSRCSRGAGPLARARYHCYPLSRAAGVRTGAGGRDQRPAPGGIDTGALRRLALAIDRPRARRTLASRSPAARRGRNEYYFGATGGGLWKTTDGGITWRPVTDGFFKTSSVGAVAVAESNPDVVYVGMGETELRGNIIQGDGVYKTTDGGKTWTHIGLGETQAIARIRIHPTNPDVVYVAALGNPYGPNPERGVFKSTDGGKTWDEDAVPRRQDRRGRSRRSIRRTPTCCTPGCGRCSARRTRCRAAGPAAASSSRPTAATPGPSSRRTPGCRRPIWGKIGVSVSRRGLATASTRSSRPTDGGVFLSDDAGATWKQVNDDRRLRQRAFYYTRIYADPKDKDTVYVLNTGFYRSTDGGKTLRDDPRAARRQPRPVDRAERPEADDQRQRRRRQRLGQRRRDLDRPGLSRPRSSTTCSRPAHVPYHVCGAQQDNSTACVLEHRRRRRAATTSGGGESGYIAPDPRDPDVFYAGSYGGLLTPHRPPDRRSARRQRLARQPDGLLVEGHHRALPVDVPDRLLADRPEDALRRRRSTSGRPPTRARAGSGSAPT